MNFLLSCIIGNRRASAYSSIAQSVEHAAVNRAVVGSSPTRGVRDTQTINEENEMQSLGPMVKRLRHRPFTAVTRVRISLGSLKLKFIRTSTFYNIYGDIAKW